MEALLVGAAALGCCVVVPAVAWVLMSLDLKKRDTPPRLHAESPQRGDTDGEG